jgi:GNAT superfamily N-acetyltransferase
MEQKWHTGLAFRHARLSDADLLAKMNQQLIRDEGHSNPMSLPELTTRMRYWLNREYKGVLFERDRKEVAYALYRLDPGWAYLRQFFVSPEYRRQGIGRQGIQILLQTIFPPRARVTVEVLWHNEAAHEFWKAVGFSDYAVTLEMIRS